MQKKQCPYVACRKWVGTNPDGTLRVHKNPAGELCGGGTVYREQ